MPVYVSMFVNTMHITPFQTYVTLQFLSVFLYKITRFLEGATHTYQVEDIEDTILIYINSQESIYY